MFRFSILAMALLWGAAPMRAQISASHVVDYTPGTGVGAYNDPSSALGLPSRNNDPGGSFPNVLSPFSPNYATTDLVRVGEGGSLTLRLERFAVVTGGEFELGIFTNIFLLDTGGQTAGDPAVVVGADPATVEVSDDGVNFVSLGSILFDMPANGWADVTDAYQGSNGSVPADFGQAYEGSLSDFNGLTNSQIVAALDGGGGGYWLDLDATGLTEVGWVRFSVPVASGVTFELDALTVNNDTVGALVVPEPAASGLFLTALAGLGWRRFWRHDS